MGAAKKQFKKYAIEEDTTQDKKQIEQYVKKLQDKLENDPELQKKAAQVIERMMNSNNKK